VTFPTTQISSFIQAPPEVSAALRKIRSEMDELEKQKDEFRLMIRELQKSTVEEPIEQAPSEIRQEVLSAGTFYVAGFVVLFLIFLLLGLSLKPTKEVMIILIFLLGLGALDWFNVLNRCESPLFDEECLDYPYAHHVEVFPGLFPPLLLDEGCTESHQKIVKLFGWKCLPITWQVDEWSFCRAECSVNRISWACVAAYWYLLACIIDFIPGRLRKKEITY
jgi:hypothetical protein